jgi:CheY-like chemotaxis protein
MSQQKVLVVDDSLTIRRLLTRLLGEAGFEVEAARDGDAGYDTALAWKPDVIISDVNMPVVDGWDFLWRIRKHDELAHTPFLFLTSRSAEQDRSKGFKMGADAYLTKPFDMAVLSKALDEALSQARTRTVATEQSTPDLSGDLQTISVGDLLQTIGAQGHTGRLSFSGQDGDEQSCYFVEGELHGATCGDMVGLRALRRLMLLEDGSFEFVATSPEQMPGRSLHGGLLKLLFQAATLNDDIDKVRQQGISEPWYIVISRELALWISTEATDEQVNALARVARYDRLDALLQDPAVDEDLAIGLLTWLWRKKHLQEKASP